MIPLVAGLSTTQLVALIVVLIIALAVVSAVVTRFLVRRGLRTPFAIRQINKGRDKVVSMVKRPITIMVLDEVADVIQTGHYTKNISDALLENHDELKALVTEKVRHDPTSRLIGRLPGYDLVVSEVTETTLRVLIEMLGDPRMDELVSDLLRNNLQQIKLAVRERQNELLPPPPPPDPSPHLAHRRRRTPG